jgi:Tfp pilus assembly protein PilZ
MADTRIVKRLRRRLSLRFGVDAPVRLAFTEDVTAHGMFIKTTNLYPPGTRIAIELILPDEKRVRLTGMIRWSKKVPPRMIHLVNKAGIGVKILKFESGKEDFRQFLEGAQAPRSQEVGQGVPAGEPA